MCLSACACLLVKQDPASEVLLSEYVGHVREPCKKAEPIEMPFVMLIRMGRRNHVLDGARPQGEGAILGVVRPVEKHWEPLQRCTQKQLNRSRCRLGLTNIGLRKHVLDCNRMCANAGYGLKNLACARRRRP